MCAQTPLSSNGAAQRAHCTLRQRRVGVYSPVMPRAPKGYRLVAATGIHKGDRAYQQDQVEIIAHPRVPGCALAMLADGMGGKSGGRKAADQVILTAKQIFERYSPDQGRPCRDAQADRDGVAPDDQADRHHRRGRAAQHDRRVPDRSRTRMRLRARRRLARLPLSRPRPGEPHDRPFVRAAPDRRRQDHRGAGQHAPAGQPADRLPGHAERPAAGHSTTSTSWTSATACWPAATACGTTSPQKSWAPSCMPCRRARPARCWSARRVSAPAAPATTCRWR